jgi:hypothetical protein
MLHIDGVTPESGKTSSDGLDIIPISKMDLLNAWQQLNEGPQDVDLIAIGSPHASLKECRMLAAALKGQKVTAATILTAGRNVISLAQADGTLATLKDAGVQVIPDLCWCSIIEPIFPPDARSVMTNSGKYAHYGPGLSGRSVRLGSMEDCAHGAVKGSVPMNVPAWLSPN